MALGPADDRDRPGREQEGLLARWSRRKTESLAATKPDRPADDPPPPETSPEVVEDTRTDADMPALETLHGDSDLSAFFAPRVSDGLRQAALRRVFHLAKHNLPDGLDDYAGDYTRYTPLGDLVTADMRHRIEVAARQAERALLGSEPPGEGRSAEAGASPGAEATSETAESGAASEPPKSGGVS